MANLPPYARTLAKESALTLETASNGLPITKPDPLPAVLPRCTVKDPKTWKGAFKPALGLLEADGPITHDALREEICKYGDFVNLTYQNFWSTKDVKDYMIHHEFQKGCKPPLAGARKFCPNELMGVPPGAPPSANHKAGLDHYKVNVAEDSPARKYSIGIPDTGGSEGDYSFYLTATSGFYGREFAGEVQVEQTNWIGFVGIGPGNDRKEGPGHLDIVVALRGTEEPTEWITDALSQMVDWDGDNDLPWHLDLLQFFLGNYLLTDLPFLPAVPRPCLKKEAHSMADIQSHVCIARGFEELYRRFASTPQSTLSLQGQVQMAVVKLLAHFGDKVGSITVTGHSLGGALATICAYDLVASGVNHISNDQTKPLIPVTAITFEAPRAGNWAFAEAFHATDGPRHLRITNVPDVVPKVPYMAYPSGGLLFSPLTTLIVATRTLLHCFGHKPGVELPRPPRGGKEHGLAFYHGGVSYKVCKGWKPSEWLLNPNRIGTWHAINLVLSAIDPQTRAPQGPVAVVGRAEAEKPTCWTTNDAKADKTPTWAVSNAAALVVAMLRTWLSKCGLGLSGRL